MPSPVPTDGTNRTVTAAAMYSMIVPAYAKRYGVEIADVKQALARIASKNHDNGARNPRAQFRKEMSVEQLLAHAAHRRRALGLRLRRRRRRRRRRGGRAGGGRPPVHRPAPLFVKALSFVVGDGSGVTDPDYDFTTFPEVVASAQEAYRQAVSPIPGPASPWLRCTTASLRPRWS